MQSLSSQGFPTKHYRLLAGIVATITILLCAIPQAAQAKGKGGGGQGNGSQSADNSNSQDSSAAAAPTASASTGGTAEAQARLYLALVVAAKDVADQLYSQSSDPASFGLVNPHPYPNVVVYDPNAPSNVASYNAFEAVLDAFQLEEARIKAQQPVAGPFIKPLPNASFSDIVSALTSVLQTSVQNAGVAGPTDASGIVLAALKQRFPTGTQIYDPAISPIIPSSSDMENPDNPFVQLIHLQTSIQNDIAAEQAKNPPDQAKIGQLQGLASSLDSFAAQLLGPSQPDKAAPAPAPAGAPGGGKAAPAAGFGAMLGGIANAIAAAMAPAAPPAAAPPTPSDQSGGPTVTPAQAILQGWLYEQKIGDGCAVLVKLENSTGTDRDEVNLLRGYNHKTSGMAFLSFVAFDKSGQVLQTGWSEVELPLAHDGQNTTLDNAQIWDVLPASVDATSVPGLVRNGKPAR